ncbi:MAG: DUF5717 family protein [Lachnospiraceae bacterium]|nr:DUF5717 family protein [Lachnospiraceae bacterium]
MQEIINQILQDHFIYDNGALAFSTPKIEIGLQKDEVYEGSFTVQGAPGRQTVGTVSTSLSRMECLTPAFNGNGDAILFRFHGEGLDEGTVMKGQFDIISSQGEYYLPYVVTVEHALIQSSMGPIKNLFHFTNLAKTEWEEAVSLFYQPCFHRLFQNGSDRQYEKIYRGLSKTAGNEQNVDEFLIALHKKQLVEYIPEDKEILMENPSLEASGICKLVKNGWGYVHLDLSCKGDFLSLEKESLNERDFLGNYCELRFYVDVEKIHSGNNLGSICLDNDHMHLEIPVTVSSHSEQRILPVVKRERKRIIAQIMELFTAFRSKKASKEIWLGQTNELLERMLVLDENDLIARLFHAQLLITRDRFNEAQWILNSVKPVVDGSDMAPEIKCYYLYLLSLNSREEEYVNQITAIITNAFERNPRNWRIAWLLLYLSEEYGKSAARRWLLLEDQFRYGCNSPILYLEAFMILQANPAILVKLERFEMQILYYGAKKKLLTTDLIDQILYLAEKEKDFSPLLLKILTACYEAEPKDVALQGVCIMLIKGNLMGTEWFGWYEKAVEAGLRITRLFEYYMMSINLQTDKLLAKTVYLYFAYQSELDDRHTAFLYANVHKHREELEDVYPGYTEPMERFVLQQILKKKNNRDLAYLYKNVFSPQMITEETAEAMAHILFQCQIRIARKDIRKVIVYQTMAVEEYSYPMKDGVAIVPVYGNDATILFEGEGGRRYLPSISYTMEKLMLPGKHAKMIAPFVKNSIGFDVFICENTGSASITEENEERFARIAVSDHISEQFRHGIMIQLLQYYYDHDKMRELDASLEQIDASCFSEKERNDLLRLMVVRGLYEQALTLLQQYGPEGMEPKLIVKALSIMIERAKESSTEPEENILYLAFFAFEKGRYNHVTLQYLLDHYEGRTKLLRDVWKAAHEQQMDTVRLEEKILNQLLYTGDYVGEKIEIFQSYLEHNPNPDLRMAFLLQEAYDYFVRDRLITITVFRELFLSWKQDGELPKVAKLAFLKYFAENKEERTEEIKPLLTEALQWILVQEKQYLSFLKEYVPWIEVSSSFWDKTVIEYKAHPDSQVILHYMLNRDEEAEGEYRTEEMESVYGGVCTKPFVLFFGETLQYYVVEKRDGTEQLTESGTISKSDIGQEKHESRFGAINDITISRSLQDYDTVDAMLYDYKQQEYVTENIFKLR